jgi:hypothetical protein
MLVIGGQARQESLRKYPRYPKKSDKTHRKEKRIRVP